MTQTSLGQCGFNRGELDNEEASWELDVLKRKETAHRLERLIANTPGPYVIAMSAEWGSGKTFFLKAWEKDLDLRQRPCVYFNAWETDHTGDPLLSLTGCIISQLKKKKYILTSSTSDLERKVTKIAKKSPQLIAKLLFGAGNYAMGGALTAFKDDLTNALDFGTNFFFENEQNREQFKKELQATAKMVTTDVEIASPDPINETKKFPLFIMIDELDRCKPSYAIELLESIKHLFSVPGVVFFISIDPYQLMTVIEHTFGLKNLMEADSGYKKDKRQEYLRKFIDLFWKLPEPDKEAFLLSQLLRKKPAIPSDWPQLSPSHIERMSREGRERFTPTSSFYRTLASAARNSNLKLREYIQIVDKFNVISKIYNITTRESIVIFDMLVHKTYDFENQNMADVIRQEDFIQDNEGNIPLDSKLSIWELFYRVSLNNSHKHDNPQISYRSNDEEGAMKALFIPRLITDFSGKQLTKSVQEKVALLEEFNFGDDANNG